MAENCKCVGKKVRIVTLKEELEVLRGEPIKVFEGDPMAIPCVEISDAEKLCKHPVVSVHMCTYNHESYIRQAIEGVMMQKTDFEFELVIGEDCSQDKTREICFEYQKKYPDKIRVLWWHENLRNIKHPGGGNSRRVMAHCRGDFIAFCEGDDYWIDPLKLQKQVDVMRKYPNVGLCFCGAYDYSAQDGIFRDFYLTSNFPVELMDGQSYIRRNVFGSGASGELGKESFVRTASAIVRVDVMNKAMAEFEILRWKLLLGDVPLWLSVSALSDVYYLQDRVAVYRINPTGVCATKGETVMRDNYLTRIYFMVLLFGTLVQSEVSCLSKYYLKSVACALLKAGSEKSASKIVKFICHSSKYRWLLKGSGFWLRLFMRMNVLTTRSYNFSQKMSVAMKYLTRIILCVKRHIVKKN